MYFIFSDWIVLYNLGLREYIVLYVFHCLINHDIRPLSIMGTYFMDCKTCIQVSHTLSS